MRNLIIVILLMTLVTMLLSAPGDLVWKFKTGNSIRLNILGYDKYVYAVSNDNILYAINANDGQLKWSYSISTPSDICSGNGMIYCSYEVSEPYRVSAFDAINGDVKWTTDYLIMYPDVCYDNNVVYIAGYGGSRNEVIACRSNDGTYIWNNRNGLQNYCPSARGQRLYVGSSSKLSCYDTSNGSLFWEYNCPVRSKQTSTDNEVFLGSYNYYVYCLNNSNGSLKWSYKTNGPIFLSRPCLWEAMEILYIGSRDSTMYALDTANGNLIWSFKTGNRIESSPFLKNGYLYFGSYDSYIYALNATNGQKVWSYKTDNFVVSGPYVNGGIVFAGSGDSYLYAIETYGYTGFKNDKSASSLPSPSFSISPNPFSTRLSVSMPSSGAVYSLTGQLIIKLDKGKHSLDTSKWREGVYIVKAGKECKRVVKVN